MAIRVFVSHAGTESTSTLADATNAPKIYPALDNA